MRWGWKRLVALAGVIAVAIATSIIGIATNRVEERAKAKTESERPAIMVRADYNWDGGDGIQWFMPETPTADDERIITTPLDVYDPRSIKRLEDHLASRGGVKFAFFHSRHGEFSRVKLNLQSTRENTVSITDIRIRTISCGPPLSAGLIHGPPQGGNNMPSLAFDLDTTETSAQEMDEDGEFKGPYFKRNFITVGRDEPMALLVHVFTTKRYCKWELVVTAIIDGVEAEYPVRRADGQPFEVSAMNRTYRQIYEFDFSRNTFVQIPTQPRPDFLPAETGEGTR